MVTGYLVTVCHTFYKMELSRSGVSASDLTPWCWILVQHGSLLCLQICEAWANSLQQTWADLSNSKIETHHDTPSRAFHDDSKLSKYIKIRCSNECPSTWLAPAYFDNGWCNHILKGWAHCQLARSSTNHPFLVGLNNIEQNWAIPKPKWDWPYQIYQIYPINSYKFCLDIEADFTKFRRLASLGIPTAM